MAESPVHGFAQPVGHHWMFASTVATARPATLGCPAPASPRRPTAIYGCTEGVPRPYRQRPNILSYSRFDGSTYLFPLVTDTRTAVLENPPSVGSSPTGAQ